MLKAFSPFQKKIILIGVVIQLIAVWLSIGFNNPDEHWQILEFANYKLGIYTKASLPWEFREQIRSAFLPTLVFVFRKLLLSVNITNPFTTALLLRLVAAAAAFFVSLSLIRYSFNYIKNSMARNIIVVLTFLLWFMPYLHCRFSSENIGAIFFFTAFLCCVRKLPEKKNMFYLLGGFLLGLSFLCRFQMAFAAIGLLLWLLFIEKIHFKLFACILTGGLAALLLGIAIDHWYYGSFVFTPYNYYVVNILKGVAAAYGTEPVWFYVTDFIMRAAPPLSLLLLAAIGLSFYYYPKHPFIWILTSFVLCHSLIAHKEARFLYPLVYILPILCAIPIERRPAKKILYPRISLKLLYYTCIAVNCILLMAAILIPANQGIAFHKNIYDLAQQKNIVVYTETDQLYIRNDIEEKFYQPEKIQIAMINNLCDITDDSLKSAGKYYYFADNHFLLSDHLPCSSIALEYVTGNTPQWLKHFDYNNWIGRTNVWCLYRIKVRQ